MSDLTTLPPAGLTVLGRGTVTAAALDEVRPTQQVSLYADPVSWLVLEAVRLALADAGIDVAAAAEEVGHVTVSDQCTLHTIRAVATAADDGRMSPLRFSGANPGSVATLPSQFLGLAGPTLTLSMPPRTGLPVALTVARAWLEGGQAGYVLVTAHAAGSGGHRVTSELLGRSPSNGPAR